MHVLFEKLTWIFFCTLPYVLFSAQLILTISKVCRLKIPGCHLNPNCSYYIFVHSPGCRWFCWCCSCYFTPLCSYWTDTYSCACRISYFDFFNSWCFTFKLYHRQPKWMLIVEKYVWSKTRGYHWNFQLVTVSWCLPTIWLTMLFLQPEPDFDQDIKDDVKDKCTKFGELKHVYVDKFVPPPTSEFLLFNSFLFSAIWPKLAKLGASFYFKTDVSTAAI